MIDELSLGLAPVVVGMLLDVVRTLNASGITVVLVEQSMNIATSIAPQAVFLEKGQVRFTGPTKELAADSDLVRSVFLRTTVKSGRPPGRPSPRRPPPVVHAERVIALEATGIDKSYGGVRAIDGADLAVYDGQILGVIGANGAGKTTLFDIISGMVRPDSGRVLLRGRDVTTMSASARAALGLGRTFQDLRLIPSMTVREVLALAHERHVEVREPVASVLGIGAALRSEAAVSRRVEELMATFNLEPFRNSFVNELSTGSRRVVELACAYANEPSVLILDEPSSGLAQREAEAMVELILDIKDRTRSAIAIIEHDIPVVLALSDEVVCMHLGQVLARGAPDAVLTDERVVAAYLGFDDVAVRRSGPVTGRAPGRKQSAKAFAGDG
jgi:branched-chain amino acid transport system ATP-binding protein